MKHESKRQKQKKYILSAILNVLNSKNAVGDPIFDQIWNYFLSNRSFNFVLQLRHAGDNLLIDDFGIRPSLMTWTLQFLNLKLKMKNDKSENRFDDVFSRLEGDFCKQNDVWIEYEV